MLFGYMHYMQSTVQPVRFKQRFLAKVFLKLLDKHSPKSSILHKIFNRNSVRLGTAAHKIYRR